MKDISVDELKAIYEAGEFEINGRVYKLGKMDFKKGQKLLSFVQQVEREGMMIFDNPRYYEYETLIFSNITFNGSSLNKLPKHFNDCPEDMLPVIFNCSGALVYPFLPKGSATA